MTQDHSALLAQLDALKSADAGAVFAELIRAGLQQLIEAEATAVIGAGRYERTESRAVHRNGRRPKTVSTTSGDVEVQIPKLRAGSFFPSLLERRRRIDKALHAVIMEAYVHGVSTRSVDDLVAAMGVETGVSKSEVSRICAGLDKEIEGFRTRSLTHCPGGSSTLTASNSSRLTQLVESVRHRASRASQASSSIRTVNAWNPPSSRQRNASPISPGNGSTAHACTYES